MVAINEFRSLKKLEGEEKKSYLNNLTGAVLKAYNTPEMAIPIDSVCHLTHILGEADNVEIDLSTGLPNTMRILQIDRMSKDVKKELEELKSRISSDVKSVEGKSLEQMVVEKIKSKIYSFDTMAAEEIISESVPFYRILDTEFTLGDKMYMLKAIESNPFSLSPQITMNYDLSGEGWYVSRFTITGFDPKENKFTGYKFVLDLNRKGKKRLIDPENSRLKQGYEEILKKQFSIGDLDLMYKEFSDIKHTWLRSVIKSTLGPYWNRHTEEDTTLLGNILKEPSNAYVLNVSYETIETETDHGEDFKRTDTSKLKKTKGSYKISHPDIALKLKEFYKNDETVKVVGVDTNYGRGGGPGGVNG
ncbi:MAG: hypothetical protein Q8O03_00635 [Nanoarchaeota archaeon]|nr:hypothetical protein [Nanoarchaeota archaeon]